MSIRLDISDFCDKPTSIDPKEVENVVVSEGGACFMWFVCIGMRNGPDIITKDMPKEKIGQLEDLIQYIKNDYTIARLKELRSKDKVYTRPLNPAIAQQKEMESNDKVYTRPLNVGLGQMRYWNEFREEALKEHFGEIVAIPNIYGVLPRYYKDFETAWADEKVWNPNCGSKVIGVYVDKVGDEYADGEGNLIN